MRIPYLLNQTPRPLFFSQHDLVWLLFESGVKRNDYMLGTAEMKEAGPFADIDVEHYKRKEQAERRS